MLQYSIKPTHAHLHNLENSGADNVYEEPTLCQNKTGNIEDEREFQNPLYGSSQDTTDTESNPQYISFLGPTGAYYSRVEEDECLI